MTSKTTVDRACERIGRVVAHLSEIVSKDDTIAVSNARLDLYETWVGEAQAMLRQLHQELENHELWVEAILCVAREIRMTRLVSDGLLRTGEPGALTAVRDLLKVKQELLAECEKTNAIARNAKWWHSKAEQEVPELLERLRTMYNPQTARFRDFEAALAAWTLVEMTDDV